MEKKTVLIVENETNLQKALLHWLRMVFGNLDFILAETGEEAVTYVEKRNPNLVLMDIGLANMNGIQATQLIKMNFPEVKIVIVTIHENEEYQKNAAAAGADAFVIKRRMYKELIPVMREILDD